MRDNIVISFVLAVTVSMSAAAEMETICANKPGTRILVLDFGLSDDTLLPNHPEELVRTASVAPYVRDHIRALGCRSPNWRSDADTLSDTATGYLSAHPGAVVEIAAGEQADWVVVGKLQKFSFMEAWLQTVIIDPRSGKLLARAESEIRAGMRDDRMTKRAAVSLAQQIAQTIGQIALQPLE